MRSIGIDLGTTNTVAAANADVLHHELRGGSQAALASVVAYPPSGAVIVGPQARKRRAIDPKNTIFSAKRLMGQDWLSHTTQRFREQYPFDLVEGPGSKPLFDTRAGRLSPADVGARVIEKVLSAHPVNADGDQVVVTVPAGFDLPAQDATLRAARAAGLSQVRCAPEPVATAVAYVTTLGGFRDKVAVYDLGGGTFDVALLDCSGPGIEVIASAGDAYLGGDDVDVRIAGWVADHVVRAHGWDLRVSPQVFDRLIVECERAKVRLGYAQSVEVALGQVDPASPVATQQVSIDRTLVEQLSADLVRRTFSVCDEVLRRASLRPDAVEAVFLAGGATLLPAVRNGVARYFGKLPRCDFDPMEVVAIGASLM